MEIQAEILKEHSKANSEKIAAFIADDKGKFDLLMNLFLNGNYRITQRSAQVVNLCSQRNPELILPYLQKILINLYNPVPEAVVRNTLRILQFVEIPDDLKGIALELGFKFLDSRKAPVAIQVFAMSMIYNIAQKQPALGRELKIIIEDKMPYSSAAFRSRGTKILDKLGNLENNQKL